MTNTTKASIGGRARRERSAAVPAAAGPQRRGAGNIAGRPAVASAAAGDGGAPRPIRAFTLIEVIGVLAVIAILLAVLLPALIKRLDRLAADKETAALKAFAQGLQQSVWKNKRVPSAAGNDWAQAIAANAGFQVSDVLTNARRQGRVFLIDPSLQIGVVTANTLPFQQTSNGVASVLRPRFMILSSLSGPLPMSSGTNGGFETIWNTPDGSVPGGWPSSWNNRGDDLKIQRINLAPSFKRLILNNSGNLANAKYSIDGTVPKTVPASLDAYFVENTLLSLYSTTPNAPDAIQVLIRDTTFTASASGTNWTGNILNWPGTGGGGGGGNDLDVIVKLYMNSGPNPYNGRTPSNAFYFMTNFVGKYNIWAGTSPPYNNSTYGNNTKNAGIDFGKYIEELIYRP